MSATFGIDYAWGRPDPHQLSSAGVRFVGRYLSHDPSKNLSGLEYNQLTDHGIAVVVVWEDTADRALAGQEAGRSDAQSALAQARQIGLPETQPIHLAIDFDAEGPQVDEYFQGAHGILTARTGAYGGYRPIDYLYEHGLIEHAWQTLAWSAGRWHPRALTRQYSINHELAGVSCDYDAQLTPPAPTRETPGYVPPDEARWRTEHDQLQHTRSARAAIRRRALHRAMVRRRQLIWELAQHTGWNHLNRVDRWKALLVRTECP